MEENKYYHPSIEEFHIGFEYEFLNKTTWITSKITLSDLIASNSDDGCENTFEKRTENIKDLRVKYLNKEDIESLGFKCVSSSDSNPIGFANDIIHINYRITDSRHLCIYNVIDRSVLFQGLVKNKSEFIVLLKQLEIQ